MSDDRVEGEVKFFSEKGFGFIKPNDGGDDVFFHARHIKGARELESGQRVSFTRRFDATRGKYQADGVEVIDADDAAAAWWDGRGE